MSGKGVFGGHFTVILHVISMEIEREKREARNKQNETTHRRGQADTVNISVVEFKNTP